MTLQITLRHENGKDRAECASFDQANSVLRRWSSSCHPTLGYDKIGFQIVHPDRDFDYKGRYDLEHWRTRFADLGSHVSRTLAYMAGTGQPPHMSADQYAGALKAVSPGAREQAAVGLALVGDLLRAEMVPQHDLEELQEEDQPAPRI